MVKSDQKHRHLTTFKKVEAKSLIHMVGLRFKPFILKPKSLKRPKLLQMNKNCSNCISWYMEMNHFPRITDY